MNKTIIYFLAVLLIFSACRPEIDVNKPSKGDADFTTYVAIGDAYTAGMQRVAMYKEAQLYSFPNLLAKQFKLVGMEGDFNQPYMPEGNDMSLGVAPNGNPSPGAAFIIGNDCEGNKTVDVDFWLEYNYVNDLQKILKIVSPVNKQGPFNNLGVGGLKSYHLIDQNYGVITDVAVDLFSGNGVEKTNPLFFRISGGEKVSIVDLACEQHPTFFTLTAGMYDYYGMAFYGYYGMLKECTPPDKFDAAMTETVKRMVTENNAKGAIANLLGIEDVGAFNYMFYNDLKIKTQHDVDMYNQAYPHMHFEIGDHNLFVMEDLSAPSGLRQLKEGELIFGLVDLNEFRCKKLGSPENPLKDVNVLDQSELAFINSRISSYNQTIERLATEYNLALVDLNKLGKDLRKGYYYQGLRFTSEPGTGFFYSIDGTHGSTQGNVVIANTFIEAINKTYNSSIPLINVAEYPALMIPNQ